MDIGHKKSGIEKKFFELCQIVLTELGLELYEMDYNHKSHLLRISIINPQTNTAVIDECVSVDQALTPYIDEADWMPETLTLEVSSPGIYRSLKNLKHFEKVQGETISLNLKTKLGSQTAAGVPEGLKLKGKVLATLDEVTKDYIKIITQLKGNEDIQLKVFYEDIKRANLEPEI